MTRPLDPIDRKILAELVANARIPISELAERVGLSKTPVALRIRQMEEMGLITGYRAILSPLRLGLTHVTYVEVRVTDTRQTALDRFNDAVRAIPEVEECYMIAGGFDYLLKVRSRDMGHFRQIMAERISALPFMRATSSHVSMEAVVEQNWPAETGPAQPAVTQPTVTPAAVTPVRPAAPGTAPSRSRPGGGR